MSEEVTVNENKGFPKGALAVFLVVFFGLALYELLTVETGLTGGEDTGILVAGGVIGVIFGSVAVFIGLSIQYAFVKFPTQWISKEEFVYKYDIWSAIFYSSAIGTVLNFMLQQFGYETNTLFSSIVSVITTGLFLFFYFSGEEKEKHIKRAITIVQLIWLVLGIALGYLLNSFTADLMI